MRNARPIGGGHFLNNKTMMKIKDGGRTDNLSAPIAKIGANSPGGSMIELWIIDANDNECLSYLTMEEACALAQELKIALKKKIDMI